MSLLNLQQWQQVLPSVKTDNATSTALQSGYYKRVIDIQLLCNSQEYIYANSVYESVQGTYYLPLL
jgi:hypothetical protein